MIGMPAFPAGESVQTREVRVMENNDLDAWDVYLLMIMLVAIGLPIAFWHHVVDWSLTHQLFLPASGEPQFVLPYADGAGLDLRRVILAGLMALLMVVAVAVLRTKIKEQQS